MTESSPFLNGEPVTDNIVAFPVADDRVKNSRFYVNPPYAGMDTAAEPVARLLGNRVMLLRVLAGDRQGEIKNGIVMPDTYQLGYNTYVVMAVGIGEWVKLKKRRVWIQPECSVGDYCISNHWARATEHQGWHMPVYLDGVDGRGRVILDARFAELTWKPETKT